MQKFPDEVSSSVASGAKQNNKKKYGEKNMISILKKFISMFFYIMCPRTVMSDNEGCNYNFAGTF